MDREELLSMIRNGATLIRMKDGREYTIPNIEWALVNTLTVHVSVLAPDGHRRAVILPLVAMTAAEQIEPHAA